MSGSIAGLCGRRPDCDAMGIGERSAEARGLQSVGRPHLHVSLAGPSQKDRRHLFETLLDSAWGFSNWLTHSKSSKWHDAEAASSVTENAVALCISAVIQHIRGVPDSCPACG